MRMKLKPAYALLLGMAAAVPADFTPALAGGLPIRMAAADCYATGQRIAAQQGGTLAAAQAATRGGQQVCVIVVLVPGAEGQRPRRQEIVVPQ